MTTYTVYQHEASGKSTVVASGFSWFACLFLFVWCLAKGLIVRGAVLFVTMIVVSVGLAALAIYLNDFESISLLSDMLLLLLSVYVGWNGNAWRTTALIRKGFVRKGSTEATSAKEALAILALES